METQELWNTADNATRLSMLDTVRYTVAEIIRDHGDELQGADSWELSDKVAEYCDGLPSVYYGEIVREWYAVDMPDAPEWFTSEGGDSDDTRDTVFKYMTAGVYGWYVERVTDGLVTALCEVCHGEGKPYPFCEGCGAFLTDGAGS